MNTRSLIVGQNLAKNSQCFHKKSNQSTRILELDTEWMIPQKGRICSLMQSLDKENLQVGVAFSFHKAQEDKKQF